MYSPKVIAQKASSIESAYPIKLKEYGVNEIEVWVERLKALIHPDSTEANPKLTRSLTEEEQNFISNEIFMCKISYPYWATRYAMIKTDKGGLARLKFWESQEMLLSTMGILEEKAIPILIINLKARQIGASTLSETVLTHKVINNHGITSLVASDEPAKSEFLFNMMERVYQHLPFYLRPHKKFHQKGMQLIFDTLDSHIYVDSGNKRTGGIGQGMAQPKWELVLTPTGWRCIGTLGVGDYVIGSNGLPTKIIGVYPQGEKENFKVTFTDGYYTECCEDHLWYVESAKDRNKKRLGKVLPLKSLMEPKNKRKAHKYFIPVVKPIAFTAKELAVDPYILGALLGDGCLTIKNRVSITIADETLKQEVEKALPKELTLKQCSGSQIDYRISSSLKQHTNTLLTGLRALNLMGRGSHTKFIPEIYQYGDIQQREAVLQGLLDTDGSVSKTDNAVEFFSMSEWLTDGVVQLVQSLGGVVNKKTRVYKANEFRDYPATGFVLRIALPTGIKPFRMQRKALIYHERQKYQPYRAIEKIEPLGKAPMVCIAIDAPDQLYVTKNYIVTHNTVHSGHLSELATWNNPEMIIEDLLPALLSGASPNTFFIMESTAKGKSGHWYNWWRAAKRKKFHDFIPVFIPWWSVTEKYAANPVEGWTPSDRILKQAATIKATKGKELNIKQMYWWDKTYESHKETNELNKFFAEYASDDQEAFQLSGSTVFPTEILNDMLREAKVKTCALYELEEKLVIK